MTVTTRTEPEKKRDLTVNKVMAGAGAAATSAVLGSYFGAAGTVVGAALGSVASTLTTTLYQHSLDRTRDTLVARIRVRRAGASSGDPDSVQTVRLPRPAFDEQGRPVGPDLDDRPPRRRRWLLAIGATLLVFTVAMAIVTGIELAKGSTLGGNASGTSVGRVVGPPPADSSPAEEETESPATPEPTEEAPQDAPPSEESTEAPEPTADPETGPGTEEAPGTSDDSPVTELPLPSEVP